MSKTVLFISGHPDDHLTSAGFLMKLQKKGYSIYEVVFTGGNGGYTSQEQRNSIETVRKEEFEKASEILGITKSFYLNYDEHTFCMNREILETMIRIIRETEPEIIIIPNRDDFHETHLEANRICIRAIMTARLERRLDLGKPTSPLLVLEWELSLPHPPDVVIDISDEWQKKEALMECYTTQVDRRLYNKIRGLNIYRGSVINAEYAEGFKVSRFIPMRLDLICDL